MVVPKWPAWPLAAPKRAAAARRLLVISHRTAQPICFPASFPIRRRECVD
jgi:hypothetical protein